MKAIERLTKQKVERIVIPGYDGLAPAPDHSVSKATKPRNSRRRGNRSYRASRAAG